MGTNYYLRKTCTCCGHEDERHLGKSSVGWTFLFQALPDQDVYDFNSWTDHIKKKEGEGYIIQDEYGDQRTLTYLLALIEAKAGERRDSDTHLYRDMFGFVFSTGDFS